MMLSVCNHCGGEYELRGGRLVCPFCGALAPERISAEELALLQMAFQKLRLAEFEEAEQEFDDIIRKYPKNHHGYWGRLMSRYGVKYEKDLDGRAIPTCYATSFEPIPESHDYKMALEYADEDFKKYYRDQVAYTERVRDEWIKKASKEDPYDIFISYKDSDRENGIEQTEDSIAAQALYAHLTAKGYRVFYSRETLKERAGEKYEPYIFQALYTAKVMIVYGTKAEYVESTWVKNEWMRYEKMIRSGAKKSNSLLVAYDGFSPAELPRVLSAVQSLDARDRGFYSDMDAVIERIMQEEKKLPPPTPRGKSKTPLIVSVCLVAALLTGLLVWAAFGGLGSADPVMNVTGSSYGAAVEAKGEGFPEGTEFIVAEVPEGGTLDDKAQILPVNKENYHLYDMKLLCDGTEIQPGQSIDVTIDLPEGIDADRAVIYYMSGDTPELLPSTVSGGKITFTTNHFSVYMVAEEEDPPCEHNIVTLPAVEPTCTKGGRTEKQYCSLCAEVLLESEEIPAKGHAHEAVVTAPTCVRSGYTDYTCACGDAYVDDHVPALGHTPGKEATCTRSQRCTVCRTELTPAKGHDYEQAVIAPTCTEQGYTKYICRGEGCEDTYKENYVDALGHTPDGSATCTKDSKCLVCHIAVAPALGHHVEAWEIDRNFSDGSAGEKHGTCTVCSETVREEISSSEGLSFVSNPDGTLSVSGKGDCKDSFIVIPSIHDGKDVTGIADYAFLGCTDLTYVFIPSSVKTVGTQAFAGCGALSAAVISEGVEKIGDGAFYRCSALTGLVIPKSVTEIGYAALTGCSSLTEITLPFVGSVANVQTDNETALFGYIFGANPYEEGVKTAQYLMMNGELYRVHYYIPSALHTVTVTGGNIPFGAFSGCTSVSTVILPETEFSIGAYAFSDCTGLQTFVIPANAKSVGAYAFSGCSALSALTVSDGVSEIGEYAFASCSALKEITVPQSVKTIGVGAFSGCSGLKAITIPFVGGSAEASEPSASTLFGYVFGSGYYRGGKMTYQQYTNARAAVVFYLPSNLTSVTVTGGKLLSGAFYGCADLKTVTVNAQGAIGESAFYGCVALESVTVGDGVTGIGEKAFFGCARLSNVTIAEGAEAIGPYAFGGCTSLKSIVVPSGVKTIGKGAFYGCSALESITVPFVGGSAEGEKKDESSLFGYIFGDDLYFGGLLTVQQYSEKGREYYYIPLSLENVTVTGGGELPYGAFSNCIGLKSITLGEGVTAIGQHAFDGCISLRELRYTGTAAQWITLAKKAKWNDNVPAKKVICSDGEAEIKK